MLTAALAAPAPEDVSPGFAGFVVMFLLALATVVLIRSMVKHLRKVRYSPDPGQPDDQASDRDTGQPPAPGPR